MLHDDAVRSASLRRRLAHLAPLRALFSSALCLGAAGTISAHASPSPPISPVIDPAAAEGARLCPAEAPLFAAADPSHVDASLGDDFPEREAVASEDDPDDPLAGDEQDTAPDPIAWDPSAFDHAPYTLLPGYEPGASLGGGRAPYADPDKPPPPPPPPAGSFLAPNPDKPYWRSNFFKRVFTDQAYLVVKWWPSEIKHLSFSGPLLGATFFAARSSEDENQFDFTIEQDVHEDHGSGPGYTAAAFFTKIGNGLPASAALGISYVLARRAGNDRLAEASSISFEALLSTGLWVEIIKRGTARHRPTGDNNGRFFQYGEKDTSSFPSGHAAGAFTIATVFAHVYEDHKWVAWVAYGTATLIGASRVALGRHFPSDVVAGAVIGNSIGRMALTRDGRLGPLSLHNFQPIYDPKNKGFGVGYRYSW